MQVRSMMYLETCSTSLMVIKSNILHLDLIPLAFMKPFGVIYEGRTSCVNPLSLPNVWTKSHHVRWWQKLLTIKTTWNCNIIDSKIKYDALFGIKFHMPHNSHANVTWSLVVCSMICVDLITFNWWQGGWVIMWS